MISSEETLSVQPQQDSPERRGPLARPRPGELDIDKSCIRFRRLVGLPLDVVTELPTAAARQRGRAAPPGRAPARRALRKPARKA